MGLSRKNFERTAKILSESKVSCKSKGKLTGDFSQYFREDNPRFDPGRFRDKAMKGCPR